MCCEFLKSDRLLDIQYRWEWQLARVLRQSTPNRPAECYRYVQDKDDPDNKVAESLYTNAVLCTYDLAVKHLESVRQDLLYVDSEAQFSFRDNVEPLYRQYVDILLKQDDEFKQEQGDSNQLYLQQATQLIDSLQLAELENYLGCNLDPIQLTDKVIDPTAAIFYPIILSDRLEVILGLPNRSNPSVSLRFIRSQPEKTPKSAVESRITQASSELVDSSRVVFTNLLSQTGILYEWLIQPFRDELEQADTLNTLVFVLDGDLRTIPMTTLWDNDRKQYLIQEYAIAVAPSLQLVSPAPLSQPIKILAAGATPKEGEVEGLKHPFRVGNFPLLNWVENELNQINELLPCILLIGENFTQPNLKLILQQEEFSIIHIATHGVFSSDPERTFLSISDGNSSIQDHQNTTENSEIEQPTPKYSDALFANEFDAILRDRAFDQRELELLVLSACDTAEGDNRAILGIAGMSIRAGARSTLATIWKAYDNPASELMQAFYQQLADEPTISRAKALQQAQLNLIEHKDWGHPAYWAPFILVGNWL